MPYEVLWPQVLLKRHITLPDLNDIVGRMHRSGEIVIKGLGAKERTPKDNHMIALPAHSKK